MLDLIGVPEFARLLGTTRQNVLKSAKRAMKPGYRGKMIPPDAVDDEGRMFWKRDRAEEFVRQYRKNAPPE